MAVRRLRVPNYYNLKAMKSWRRLRQVLLHYFSFMCCFLLLLPLSVCLLLMFTVEPHPSVYSIPASPSKPPFLPLSYVSLRTQRTAVLEIISRYTILGTYSPFVVLVLSSVKHIPSGMYSTYVHLPSQYFSAFRPHPRASNAVSSSPSTTIPASPSPSPSHPLQSKSRTAPNAPRSPRRAGLRHS